MQITVTDLFDGVTPETSPVTITVVEGSATSGLADDDHTQYHTNARGDARYWPLSTDLATQVELDAHAADTTSVHGITDTASLVLTDDARLTNARTPTAHATSHQDGGSDELGLDGSQITSGTVADARIASTIARDSEVTAAVAAHEGDTSDAHDASAVSFSPTGALASTDVQAAIAELDTEKSATGHNHSGTYIPVGDVAVIDQVTQAAYDGLTPVATTLYLIVG
jgi:hypothetical protein